MRSKRGFSLTELLVVVAIILVVGSVSVPSIARSIERAKLKAAAQQVADIYQQARIRSAQDNSYHEVLVSPPGIAPATACLDVDADGQCGPTDPATVLPANVQLISAGLPVVLDPTALGFSPITSDSSNTYNQQNKLVHALAWNSRGLPCQRISPTSACTPTGWVQYLEVQHSQDDTSYAAITVSPAGRVKVWNYSTGGNAGADWY